MTHDEKRGIGTKARSRSSIILALAALLLGLLALVVTLEGLSGRANAPTTSITLINLVTAVSGIAGAVGYWRGKTWGVYVFALSVLGHSVAHLILLLSAIASGRTSPGAVIGLAVVPVVASVILVGMVRQGQPVTRR